MMFGWSWTSGPLWTPTMHPPLLVSPMPMGGTCGGITHHGTTPTQVLLHRIGSASPAKTVCDKPSVTSRGACGNSDKTDH